jgi:hypothetical protein
LGSDGQQPSQPLVQEKSTEASEQPASAVSATQPNPAESSKGVAQRLADFFENGVKSVALATGPRVSMSALALEKAKTLHPKIEAADQNRTKLMGSSGYQKLSLGEKAQALYTFGANPASDTSTKQLVSLLENNNFQSLSSAQKSQALKVFKESSPYGKTELLSLANREVNGKSALLDTDKNGKTLLGSLHRLAARPLGAENPTLRAEFKKAGITQQGMLDNIMLETASPGEINQDNKGTCTVTSMQYMLSQQNPAEYARIMQGLVSKGEVELRGGNEPLKISPGSIERDDAYARSSASRIFQSAMMDLSNGKDDYDNKTDRSTTPLGKISYRGLIPSQMIAGMEALFGGKFKNETSNLQDVSAYPTPVLVGMKWSQHGDKHGRHAVILEKVEDGRVYLRNPWGPQPEKANGSELQNPPRRMENNETGLESMSIADFQARVVGYRPQVQN